MIKKGAILTHCPICEEQLSIKSLYCSGCATLYDGAFVFPRLARLSKEEQRLAEALIVHGGNLKEMALALGLSYPTLKKRLNELSLSLQAKQKADEEEIDRILTAMENGTMHSKEGVKRIREINGEL